MRKLKLDKKTPSDSMLQGVRSQLREEQQKISDTSRRGVIVSMLDSPDWLVFPDEWIGAEHGSVYARLCILDTHADDTTIINVHADPGGYIIPHKHDRAEGVHVIEGSYKDVVNGKTYTVGQTQVVPAGDMHGLESTTGALLVVTWRPAFSYTAQSTSVDL